MASIDEQGRGENFNAAQIAPDANAALAMLNTLASVGATAFDVTLLDIDGKERGFEPRRSLEEMRRTIARRLQEATAARHSLVIRPRSASTLLIQLDDFDPDRAQRDLFSFMRLETSPNNYQLWLAVSDGPKESEKEAAKDFRTRVRRGAGADHSATGATRIAGGFNFKTKYGPNFPVVKLSQIRHGKTVTVNELEQAGLLAPREQPAPQPPASVPPSISTNSNAPRHWPDWNQALRGAPRKGDGTPDRSLADFMFCKWASERGWSVEQIAEKLAEVSAKAQERIRVKDDKGYPLLTAQNAAKAVERERHRRQSLKSPPGHQK